MGTYNKQGFKIGVLVYSIVYNHLYLQFNSLLLFTSHNTVAYIPFLDRTFVVHLIVRVHSFLCRIEIVHKVLRFCWNVVTVTLLGKQNSRKPCSIIGKHCKSFQEKKWKKLVFWSQFFATSLIFFVQLISLLLDYSNL